MNPQYDMRLVIDFGYDGMFVLIYVLCWGWVYGLGFVVGVQFILLEAHQETGLLVATPCFGFAVWHQRARQGEGVLIGFLCEGGSSTPSKLSGRPDLRFSPGSKA